MSQPTDSQIPPRRSNNALLETARTIALALLFGLSIRVAIAEAYLVDGPSMEPTLVDHQRVWVAKYAYGLSLPGMNEAVATWSTPSVGDVVVFNSPADGLDLVKRVIGVPGDTIEIRDGLIYRNGEMAGQRLLGDCDPATMLELDPACEWVEEALGPAATHTISRSSFSEPLPHFVTVVPEGQVFLMGDHRDQSNDSRFFGAVPINRMRGRVL